ncbi:MMPL family transporter, partial [Myxococcota bacterium]|nr:MMPL family transporter [Myxococcota bacterium]
GFFWEYIDSDILIIAIIAIGVGVDDTIHFLMRFRIEALRHENISEVISQTFFYAGRGIIMTSIILILGFAPFAFSDYFSIWVFGTMLPLTLFVALIADLFFLPALAQLGLIRFQRPPGHGTNANEIKA